MTIYHVIYLDKDEKRRVEAMPADSAEKAAEKCKSWKRCAHFIEVKPYDLGRSVAQREQDERDYPEGVWQR